MITAEAGIWLIAVKIRVTYGPRWLQKRFHFLHQVKLSVPHSNSSRESISA